MTEMLTSKIDIVTILNECSYCRGAYGALGNGERLEIRPKRSSVRVPFRPTKPSRVGELVQDRSGKDKAPTSPSTDRRKSLEGPNKH